MSQLWAVVQKDLTIEWHVRIRIVTLIAFGFTVLLLFSFAVGADGDLMQKHAGAYLWMTVLLASTLQLDRSFLTETETGALEALLLLPTSPAALFYGKALSNWMQLLILSVACLPVLVVLYDAQFVGPVIWLGPVLLLGTAGLAAPGTLYAGMTARIRGGQVVLPLLLFPLVVPAMLAAVKAFGLVVGGDPMGQTTSWVGLLVCFDLIYWSLAGLFFTRIVEL